MASEKRMNVVILGLLKHEPLTGYEIKKRIDTSLKYFWSGSFGSIYPTLNALEEEGMVVKTEEASGRGKITYSITESGRAVLHEWLEQPVKKDVLHYETLLKIFYGGELGKEGTIEHLNNFERTMKENLANLKMYEKELKAILEGIDDPNDDHNYYMLTLKFGIETYSGYLRWCEEAKKMLK